VHLSFSPLFALNGFVQADDETFRSFPKESPQLLLLYVSALDQANYNVSYTSIFVSLTILKVSIALH
jgi:hypothetical protein